MINVGVVGCGYWGPKLIRNFYEIPESNLALVCDLDEVRLRQVKRQYPHVETTTSFNGLLQDGVDAVVIATPVNTHYKLVKEALSRGKHVLVEKPMTSSSREARELTELAAEQNRVLMVGHIYEYHPAVDFLKQLIKNGELGEIYAIDAHRLNLGLFRSDVNVLWDLGPHDLSIVLTLMDREPVLVSARGSGHLNPNLCDLAYLELIFPSGTSAHIHLSWLDPRKVRQVTIIGSKKMAFYDDVAEAEKVFLYDKGCAFNTAAPCYHYGDVTIPFISSVEPLKVECSHFLQCVQDGTTPRTDGMAGLKIINILEAANKSMLNGGQRINLKPVSFTRKTGDRQVINVK
ncbi:MAG: Gfo/Idh/MocA family oxidoreductase [Dehalococcoidales bacterium]|nr:Gfo/Idh/MocA family oxidoreductase [Dehalococcoidales bacterium]